MLATGTEDQVAFCEETWMDLLNRPEKLPRETLEDGLRLACKMVYQLKRQVAWRNHRLSRALEIIQHAERWVDPDTDFIQG